MIKLCDSSIFFICGLINVKNNIGFYSNEKCISLDNSTKFFMCFIT